MSAHCLDLLHTSRNKWECWGGNFSLMVLFKIWMVFNIPCSMTLLLLLRIGCIWWYSRFVQMTSSLVYSLSMWASAGCNIRTKTVTIQRLQTIPVGPLCLPLHVRQSIQLGTLAGARNAVRVSGLFPNWANFVSCLITLVNKQVIRLLNVFISLQMEVPVLGLPVLLWFPTGLSAWLRVDLLSGLWWIRAPSLVHCKGIIERSCLACC